MAYAENTTVPVEKSISEILAMLKKAGAHRIAQAETEDGFAVQCFLNDRMLRFKITYPSPSTKRGARPASPAEMRNTAERRMRQRARALLLVIKAKLESIESEVETFDEAFLANVVTPDGATVGDWLIPQIQEGYRIGKMPTQLLLTSIPA